MHITKALAVIEKGRLIEDLDAAVKKVVAAVNTTGRAGAVTLKIKIRRADDESVTLDPVLTESIPAPARKEAVFFVDVEGGLSREHPQQKSLFEDRDTPADDAGGEEKTA